MGGATILAARPASVAVGSGAAAGEDTASAAAPQIARSSAATSTSPRTDRRPSTIRALSRSVCSLPTTHVAAFDIAL
jgi:hypothetical protein